MNPTNPLAMAALTVADFDVGTYGAFTRAVEQMRDAFGIEEPVLPANEQPWSSVSRCAIAEFDRVNVQPTTLREQRLISATVYALLEHQASADPAAVVETQVEAEDTTRGSELYVIRHVPSQFYYTGRPEDEGWGSLQNARKFLSSSRARHALQEVRLVGHACAPPYELVPVVEERRFVTINVRAELV